MPKGGTEIPVRMKAEQPIAIPNRRDKAVWQSSLNFLVFLVAFLTENL